MLKVLRRPRLYFKLALVGFFLPAIELPLVTAAEAPEGWLHKAPREEIAPKFTYEPEGGPSGSARFVIESDGREGQIGWWTKSFPVKGGEFYRFSALRRVEKVASPRRCAVARILWRDAKGNSVLRDQPSRASYRPAAKMRALPEFPSDELTNGQKDDSHSWTEVSDVYRAPSQASQALVELGFRWAAGGKVEWSAVSLRKIDPPPPRTVRLATVHYSPKGGSNNHEKCRQFAPLIAKAAEQKADFVVLPETLTYYQSGRTYEQCAEPIPGPSTEYFGQLAKQHDLYIVAGLLEKSEHLPLQRGSVDRPRWQDRRQVPQSLFASQRDRSRHDHLATTTLSLTRGLAA